MEMSTIYLPIAGGPVSQDPALTFFRLLATDPRQQRTRLDLCPALVAAAQQRAHGLANGDPWSHCDRDGVWPNEIARRNGCALPEWYAVSGNQIESLTAGAPDPQVAFDSVTNDSAPIHRSHLFGESDFFREQTQCGIGYAMRVGSEFTVEFIQNKN